MLLRAQRWPIVVPWRRVVTVLLWATVATNLLFLVGLLLPGGQTSPVVSVGLTLATQWVPVGVFWAVAIGTGFRRLDVIFAASAVTLSALGDVYYTTMMDADGYLAFPSPADVGYLLFYPLAVGALVALVRSQVRGTLAIVVLEGAIASLGTATLLAVLLDPVVGAALSGDGAFESAVALAYPLFDVLLLAVMAGITAAPGVHLGPRWWALATGLAIFAVADIVYALWVHQGSYFASTPLDASWAIGLAFIAWWVAGAMAPTVAPTRIRKPLAVPIPAIAVIAGLVVLVVATQVPLSLLAVVLATVTVSLAAVPIIFRQAVMGRLLAAQQNVVRQLTELDEDKSAMMATMNHEFRPPVTKIKDNVELLLDGKAGELPPPAVDMLGSVRRGAARLQGLIDDLLTMSKLEGRTASMVLTRSDLSGVLKGAITSLRPLARSKDVHLTTDVDSIAMIVDADRGQLQKAFSNLIENAIKFTPALGIVRVTAQYSDAGHVLVRVTDTGMGIPAEDIPRLFTRFFRAGNAHDAAIPGAGLGLSIAENIVRAHSGTLTVSSVIGEGTTVTVSLPKSHSDVR